MGYRISWSVNANIEDGPSLASSHTVSVYAFDVVVTKVLAGGSETRDVQPSGTGSVKFFSINSDRYGSNLKFSVDGGVQDVALEGPMVLSSGIDTLLQKAPKKIKLDNGLPDEATVEIVVGRDP